MNLAISINNNNISLMQKLTWLIEMKRLIDTTMAPHESILAGKLKSYLAVKWNS